MANKLLTSMAKEFLFNSIMEMLQEHEISCSLIDGKKLYCNIKEKTSNEVVQLCVTMTCPKEPIFLDSSEDEDNNTEEEKNEDFQEYTEEEKQTIKELIQEFNL